MESLSFYQATISILIICWLVSFVLVWVRFDRLVHGKYILVAVIMWPLVLTDEWLKLSGQQTLLHFLAGAFQFIPAAVAAMLLLSIRKVTTEKVAANGLLFLLPAIMVLVGQIPFLALNIDEKLGFLMAPPMGDPLSHWPYFATYLFSQFMILSFAVHGAEFMSRYHYYLSDQVVDVDLYEMKFLANSCYILMVMSVINIGIIGLVTFALLPIDQWQTLVNLSQGSALMLMILLLLDKRRFSPTPFTEQQFNEHGYSDEFLRATLKKAEKAIIQYKAYKRKGLRLKQLADAADIEPVALALATRMVLKRNFRAFIYHYRLEYAKKVLMRTDQKVTSVAKRLGFNSEKYLSEVFVKYIRMMGKTSSDAD